MGCILGKQRPSGESPASGDPRKSSISSNAAVVENTRPTRRPSSRRRSRIPSFPPRDPSGWPACLLPVVGNVLRGWTPRRLESFRKLDKIGSGTYSNVYKARDLETGRLVALKKVKFHEAEPESMRFMMREITVLERLDHPNVVRLEGIAVSRVSPALYLIFEYMEHDLAGLTGAPGVKFSEPQVKCYMKQLLSGLEHCHNQGVLHRDLKGSNLLIDNEGILKIADFGLACTFDPDYKEPMTSKVVTLWYRAPELILGEEYYDVGIDLWSAGCILAELFSRKPILPGSSEVDQIYRIWRLCGSPSEEYWKKFNLPSATIFKTNKIYKRSIFETFKSFPASSQSLIDTLLSLDPSERGTATAALNSAFFTTEPFACEPSSLPQYPPSKEMDVIHRHERARRPKVADGKGDIEATRKLRSHSRRSRAFPAPEANADLQFNLDRRRLMTREKLMSKSQKFPPPHQDGGIGIGPEVLSNRSFSFAGVDSSFASSISKPSQDSSGALAGKGAAKRSTSKENHHVTTSHALTRTLRPTADPLLMEINGNSRVHRRAREEEMDFF